MNGTNPQPHGLENLEQDVICPTGTSIPGQFEMFAPMTCADTASAISSPGLADSPSHSDGRVLRTCLVSGPAHLPVSHSLLPERALLNQMNDTSPPVWLGLIKERGPAMLFGEQVADAIGKGWLDDLFNALEREGYACGAAVLPACSVGAPHIRKRLFFGAVRLADADNTRPQGWAGMPERTDEQPSGPRGVESGSAHPHNSFWSDADWLGCRDGKFRPVEPFPQQMVDGFSTGLGPMCDTLARETIKEIENATESCSSTEQALRNLWIQYAEEAIQWPSGRLISFQSPQVLLTVMRELTRKGWSLGHHLFPACWQSAEEGLREMRRSALASSGSPHIRRQVGQHSSESTDALSILSQTIAHAARKWAVNRDPLNFQADKRDNRVGRLRGYGNAIVPQAAAVFIEEFMKSVDVSIYDGAN